MFDIPKETATAAIDEAAKQLVPVLDPVLQKAVATLLAGLQDLLKGRTITITIQ